MADVLDEDQIDSTLCNKLEDYQMFVSNNRQSAQFSQEAIPAEDGKSQKNFEPQAVTKTVAFNEVSLG